MSATKKQLDEKLRRKTSQLHLTFQKDKSNHDLYKIGKCVECLEWFMVLDRSKQGHPMCPACQSHYDVTHLHNQNM